VFNLIFRFRNTMECIFKLRGLLSTLTVLVLEIVILRSQCWRLWDFNNKVVKFVSLGLWEACYPQEFNVSGTAVKILVNTPFNSTWTVSPEFQYAQTMILWAIFMKPIVLVFGAIGIKISYMKDPFLNLQMYCYKACALILCVSSLYTLVSVSWNHFVDHYGHTTFDFPPNFPVKKEALIKKHYTAVFPIGLLTTAMSYFGMCFFLTERRSLKLQSQTKAQHACILADQEA
ncbi:hypothetical protein H671_xg20361, partial [Cricetulus griseus]